MKISLLKLLLLSCITHGVCKAESRVKIAVIDSGLRVDSRIKPYLCRSGHHHFKSSWDTDVHGHGTNIANLIADNINPATHCLMIMKVFYYKKVLNHIVIDSADSDFISESIRLAVQNGAKYINMSIGSGTQYLRGEDLAIKSAIANKVHIILSAGNNRKLLTKNCKLYPVCNKYDKSYFHIVGSKTNGSVASYSNYGPIVDAWVDGTNKGMPAMSGTSQSAAIFTGRFVSAFR